MQVFKFLILMLIWASSTAIGILISKKYVNRVIELKEIKNALNMLETKIKFTYEPLQDIFNQIAESMTNNTARIFEMACREMRTMSAQKAWEYGIDNALLNLNKEDTNVLKELGKLLRQNRH